MLINSDSMKELALSGNNFGIDGVVRSLVPFLEACSSQLTKLSLGHNNEINTECFELVVSSLQNGIIKDLSTCHCSITDISALETYNLPNLQCLSLSYNNIGREGCIIISNQLQKEGSTLTYLDLEDAGIDNEGAEMIANSLKHNTTLKTLYLIRNNITEKGFVAFLKLVVDISSIENTYNSNHTLSSCPLYVRQSPLWDEKQTLTCSLRRDTLYENRNRRRGRW